MNFKVRKKLNGDNKHLINNGGRERNVYILQYI